LVIFYFALSFFFQAEDGIRYFHVTGVQTCALPISHLEVDQPVELLDGRCARVVERRPQPGHELVAPAHEDLAEQVVLVLEERVRSEERRVGKESGTRYSR